MYLKNLIQNSRKTKIFQSCSGSAFVEKVLKTLKISAILFSTNSANLNCEILGSWKDVLPSFLLFSGNYFTGIAANTLEMPLTF